MKKCFLHIHLSISRENAKSKDIINIIEVNFEIGEKISPKSTPLICEHPLATS